MNIREKMELEIDIIDNDNVRVDEQSNKLVKSATISWNPETVEQLYDSLGNLEAAKELISVLCVKLTGHILNKKNK